jgi:hypothetical protein
MSTAALSRFSPGGRAEKIIGSFLLDKLQEKLEYADFQKLEDR